MFLLSGFAIRLQMLSKRKLRIKTLQNKFGIFFLSIILLQIFQKKITTFLLFIYSNKQHMGNDFKPPMEEIRKNDYSNNHRISMDCINQLSCLPKNIQDHLEKKKIFQSQLKKVANSPIKIYKGNQYYQGEVDEFNKPEGFGKLSRSDESLLLANFKNGRAEGFGTYIFKDGSYFEGMISDNAANGQGTLTNNKVIYKGNFSQNLFNGQGKLQGQNWSFEGKFEKGRKKQGILKWPQSPNSFQENVYSGEFNDLEEFDGKGTLKTRKGTYTGTFKNGKKHGQGVFEYKIGLVYKGDYFEDEKHGQGTIYNPEKIDNKFTYAIRDDLVAYRGSIKHGLPDGKGEIFSKKEQKFMSTIWIEGISKEQMEGE